MTRNARWLCISLLPIAMFPVASVTLPATENERSDAAARAVYGFGGSPLGDRLYLEADWQDRPWLISAPRL